jgi:arylsulfatase A-like enzyme
MSSPFPTATRPRRLAVLALLALAAAGCDRGAPDGSRNAEAPGGERPNVLLVTLDTTRADHLGCYGYQRPTSPNLDELAQSSIVFENATSTSSWTLPAHASLFTGKFPTTHGVRHDPEGPLILAEGVPGVPAGIRARGLAPEEETLASVLAGAGYATGAVVAGPWLLRVFGLDSGFQHYDDSGIETNAGRRAASVTDAAERWLAGVLAEGDRPFFLFLNYFDPHAPYWPPPSYARTFLPPGTPPRMRSRAQAPALYDAEILYMDAELGRLLRFLRERGVWDDTLIAVTADHGELLGEHGEWGHERFLWEELVHVPLIVKPPGQQEGRREPGRAQVIDLLPMILSSAGVAPPPGVQGAPPPSAERPVLAEVNPISSDGATGSWRAQWHGDSKFIWNTLGQRFLFDLASDPHESENLFERDAERSRHAEAALLRTFESLPQAPDRTGPATVVDEQTREALRELGYIQ